MCWMDIKVDSQSTNVSQCGNIERRIISEMILI